MSRDPRPGRRDGVHPLFAFVAVSLAFLGPLLLLASLIAPDEPRDQREQRLAAVLALAEQGGSYEARVGQGASDVAPARVADGKSTEAKPARVTPLPPAAILATAPPPEVSARSFAVIERSCGTFLYGVNEHERLPPASLTKIVTALVVERVASRDTVVDVHVSGSQMVKRGSSVMGIEPGQQYSIIDLLYGLFLPSGNDAALALAQHVGGGDVARFVDLMNEEAAGLGLRNTHFTNPHGLDNRELYSTAFDMALAGRRFLEDPDLAALSTTPRYVAGDIELNNGNKLLRLYPGAFGVKIGFTTRAKQTIVAAAERDGRQLVLSVLGSEDRYADSIALFDWAFASLPAQCR